MKKKQDHAWYLFMFGHSPNSMNTKDISFKVERNPPLGGKHSYHLPMPADSRPLRFQYIVAGFFFLKFP